MDTLTEEEFFKTAPLVRCLYKNCEKPISGRKGKKFCNQKCRKYHYTYEKRDLLAFKNEKSRLRKLIKEAENVDNSLIELYKNIFK